MSLLYCALEADTPDTILLATLLDVRDADGSLALPINRVDILVDREIVPLPSGSFALPINRVRHGYKTIFDYALKDGFDYTVNQEVIDLLKANGAKKAVDLSPQEMKATEDKIRQQREQLKIIRQTLQNRWEHFELLPNETALAQELLLEIDNEEKARLQAKAELRQQHLKAPPLDVKPVAQKTWNEVKAEIKNISEHGQNTHRDITETTVEASARKLIALYPQAKENEETNFNEVERYVKAFAPANKRNTALAALAAIRNYRYNVRPRVPLTTLWTLSLVWEGIKDAVSIPDKNNKPEHYIKHRKDALIDRLHEIATTYGHGRGGYLPSCSGGTQNLLMLTLHGAHRDVYVETTTKLKLQNYLSEIYTDYRLKEDFNKLALKQQRELLFNWDEEKPGENFISYLAETRQRYANELHGLYTPALTFRECSECVAHIKEDTLPRPTVHQGLDELIHAIDALSIVQGASEQHTVELAALKHAAIQAYHPSSERTFEEEFQLLKTQCERFYAKNVSDLKRVIRSQSESDDKSVNNTLYKKLNKLVEEKTTTPPSNATEHEYVILCRAIHSIKSINATNDKVKQQDGLDIMTRELITSWIDHHLDAIQNITQFSTTSSEITISQQNWKLLNTIIQQAFNKIAEAKLTDHLKPLFQANLTQLIKPYFNATIHHPSFAKTVALFKNSINAEMNCFDDLTALIAKIQTLENTTNPLSIKLLALLKQQANAQPVAQDCRSCFTQLNAYYTDYIAIEEALNQFLSFNITAQSSIVKQLLQKFLGQFNPQSFADFRQLNDLSWTKTLDPLLHTLETIEANLAKEYKKTNHTLTGSKQQALKTLTTQITSLINNPNNTIDFSNKDTLKTQFVLVLNQFKTSAGHKELSRSRSWGEAFAALKNALLVLTPLIGWACLAYRAYKGQTFFDTRTRSQRCVDILHESITRPPSIAVR